MPAIAPAATAAALCPVRSHTINRQSPMNAQPLRRLTQGTSQGTSSTSQRRSTSRPVSTSRPASAHDAGRREVEVPRHDRAAEELPRRHEAEVVERTIQTEEILAVVRAAVKRVGPGQVLTDLPHEREAVDGPRLVGETVHNAPRIRPEVTRERERQGQGGRGQGSHSPRARQREGCGAQLDPRLGPRLDPRLGLRLGALAAASVGRAPPPPDPAPPRRATAAAIGRSPAPPPRALPAPARRHPLPHSAPAGARAPMQSGHHRPRRSAARTSPAVADSGPASRG